MERLDTLLLEIRHTQVNIIHSLREPVLYRNLRFEERYLWGHYHKLSTKTINETWLQLLCEPGFSASDCANAWIPRYPSPGLEVNSPNNEDSGVTPDENRTLKDNSLKIEDLATAYADTGTRKSIGEAISKRVEEVWQGGQWSLDQKRHYYNLQALQGLKRNILRDKLILCWWAISAFDIKGLRIPGNRNHASPREELARFMVVRAGVMARAREAVERLGDLQAQYEKALDVGLQEHPRPSLARRREQGIYSGFLADQTRDLFRQINMLLDFQQPSAPPPKSDGRIMHRWTHDFTSHSHIYQDEVPRTHEQKGSSDTAFINTSYWMPERPDLQSVIAHEVAHIAIHRRYGQCSTEALSAATDPFARLLRLLSHALESFGVRQDKPHVNPRHLPQYTLKEITADLLGASVEGHAYLLALFLEIAGNGLEVLFDAPGGRYELELAHRLEDNGGLFDRDREWYYRLRVSCAWLKAVHHNTPPTPLDNLLVQGVEEIVDDMLTYLDKISTNEKRSGGFWRTLADRMSRLAEDSDAAIDVRNWRKQRSQDFGEGDTLGPWLYPRFTWRIAKPLRDTLFQRILVLKTTDAHPLKAHRGKQFSYLAEKFDDIYFGGKQSTTAGKDDEDPVIAGRPLFQHLYDIPWQCALLRSMDFVHSKSEFERDDWLKQMHCNTALGRELYQLALEFRYWQSRSGYQHLTVLAQQVEGVVNSPKSHPAADQDLIHKLSDWLGKDVKEPKERKDIAKQVQTKVKEMYNTYLWEDLCKSAAKRREFRDERLEWLFPKGGSLLETFAAKQLLFAYLNFSFSSEEIKNAQRFEHQKRIIEKLLAHKTNQLQKIIGSSDTPHWLLPLSSYLKMAGVSSSPNRDKVFNFLLKRFAPTKKSAAACTPDDRPSNSFEPRYYNISRISVAGSYDADQSRSVPLSTLFNRMGEKAIYHWPVKQGSCGHKDKQIWAVIGRYDFLSLQPTRPMCRCSLPHFPNDVNNPVYPIQPDEETFPTFFVRREQAIPIRMDDNEDWPDNETPFIAALSIVLTRRQARLDLVSRLLYAKANTSTPSSQTDGLYLEQLGPLLLSEDRMFLSEGWGDVILFFSGEADLKRLEEIFLIQRVIFEDFQVDRTELILTPSCMEAATPSDACNVSVQVRLMEDRKLEHGDLNFEKQIIKNWEASDLEQRALGNNSEGEKIKNVFTICRTPGRTDYTLGFRGLHKLRNSHTKPLGMPDIYSLMKDTELDVLQTNIGLQVYPENKCLSAKTIKDQKKT
ncbi:MAG: hypothetical protein JMN26_11805 [gamma proteobacterium endosymbiont of Lamellibrachia anaximandri]|nr:hypothetical protein [gamma proteobacterium endosymbiont of Lamellibrachia anaximandri]